MNSNQKTLAAYEAHLPEYINGTPQEVSGGVKVWIDGMLAELTLTDRILEIGSAFGRDADYIEQTGFTVERTDAAEGFVDYLRGSGKQAEILNVLTDRIAGPYNLIFADAVFLHFNDEEFVAAAKNVFDALSAGGIFGLTLKKGDGQEWSDAKLGVPRFFRYWQPEELQAVLTGIGFTEVSIGNTDPKWLHTMCRR